MVYTDNIPLADDERKFQRLIGDLTIDTGIRFEGDDGIAAWFKIGHQMFTLNPVESIERAIWYKSQLDKAFANLQRSVTKTYDPT